ncbi:MAG: ATP-binding protein [Candidatus Woesebacteria bacterium]|nr:MAG: ATP-binding protein [Candidatus Woesebacteria bacterium]
MGIEKVKATGFESKELRISVSEPIVVVVFGKIGVGKTTIANEISLRLETPTLSSDVFRRKRISEIQYEPWHSEVALEDMLDNAQKLFDEGAHSVVLDATFSKLEYRQKAVGLAQRNNKKVVWIEVVCEEEVAGKGNIDGQYISREVDSPMDIEERIVIDNSIRTQNIEEQIKTLVDFLFLPK